MISQGMLPTWSPRAPKSKIRRLYELDAKGIHDDELADDVGYALFSRCKSFLAANMAVRGKAPCPNCGSIILHKSNKEERMICKDCDWELTWGEYFRTIQNQQLSGAEEVIALFQNYVGIYPASQTYHEKMYQIDRLIHGFHWHLKYGATRPVAVNLIDGKLTDVIEFLDNLNIGETSSPGMQKTRAEWMENSKNVRAWQKGKNSA